MYVCVEWWQPRLKFVFCPLYFLFVCDGLASASTLVAWLLELLNPLFRSCTRRTDNSQLASPPTDATSPYRRATLHTYAQRMRRQWSHNSSIHVTSLCAAFSLIRLETFEYAADTCGQSFHALEPQDSKRLVACLSESYFQCPTCNKPLIDLHLQVGAEPNARQSAGQREEGVQQCFNVDVVDLLWGPNVHDGLETRLMLGARVQVALRLLCACMLQASKQPPLHDSMLLHSSLLLPHSVPEACTLRWPGRGGDRTGG